MREDTRAREKGNDIEREYRGRERERKMAYRAERK